MRWESREACEITRGGDVDMSGAGACVAHKRGEQGRRVRPLHSEVDESRPCVDVGASGEAESDSDGGRDIKSMDETSSRDLLTRSVVLTSLGTPKEDRSTSLLVGLTVVPGERRLRAAQYSLSETPSLEISEITG